MESKIKSFEDACAALNKNAADYPGFEMITDETRRKYLVACDRLPVIAEALNNEAKTEEDDEIFPNWNNSDQRKYFPWFEVHADDERPAGFGLSYDDCDYWHSNAVVGSRLCLRTWNLAKYAGEQFKELYEDLFLVK